METKEKNFEQDIETYLLNEGGYIKGDQSTYDKKRAIDMPVLLQFIQNTQPKVWQRYVNLYGDKSSDQLYKVFQSDVANYGLVHVLRNGVKDRGVAIKFCYFKPRSASQSGLAIGTTPHPSMHRRSHIHDNTTHCYWCFR